MKVIEARLNGSLLEVKINSTWFNVSLTANENDLLEFKDKTKDRVKQALKLKEAGFTGKEIIDIIGEVE